MFVSLKQTIDFPLGVNDISTLFRFPTTLYGRAREIEQLRDVIYRVADRATDCGSSFSRKRRRGRRRSDTESEALCSSPPRDSSPSPSNTDNAENEEEEEESAPRAVAGGKGDLNDGNGGGGGHNRIGCEVAVVSGPAGMGKTAIILAVQDKARRYGLFASGKFDQRSIPKPYSAIIDCVITLIPQVCEWVM